LVHRREFVNIVSGVVSAKIDFNGTEEHPEKLSGKAAAVAPAEQREPVWGLVKKGSFNFDKL
jgi:hypothetical protein